MIRGVMNSECLMPSENDGADCLLQETLSGQWAPGPGFCVESKERTEKLLAILEMQKLLKKLHNFWQSLYNQLSFEEGIERAVRSRGWNPRSPDRFFPTNHKTAHSTQFQKTFQL